MVCCPPHRPSSQRPVSVPVHGHSLLTVKVPRFLLPASRAPSPLHLSCSPNQLPQQPPSPVCQAPAKSWVYKAGGRLVLRVSILLRGGQQTTTAAGRRSRTKFRCPKLATRSSCLLDDDHTHLCLHHTSRRSLHSKTLAKPNPCKFKLIVPYVHLTHECKFWNLHISQCVKYYVKVRRQTSKEPDRERNRK